jgi:hypothetical protein
VGLQADPPAQDKHCFKLTQTVMVSVRQCGSKLLVCTVVVSMQVWERAFAAAAAAAAALFAAAVNGATVLLSHLLIDYGNPHV